MVEHRLPVFGIALCRNGLTKGSRILKGEAFLGQFLAIPHPDITTGTFVTFIYQYQVVALESLNCYRFISILICQFIDVDDFYSLALKHATDSLLTEHSNIHIRSLQLFIMLTAQSFIRSQYDDAVEFLGMMDSGILLILLDVDMHQQSLARTGCIPIGQLIQVINRKVGQLMPGFCTMIEVIMQKTIQVVAKCLRITEILVEIDFREQEG